MFNIFENVVLFFFFCGVVFGISVCMYLGEIFGNIFLVWIDFRYFVIKLIIFFFLKKCKIYIKYFFIFLLKILW